MKLTPEQSETLTDIADLLGRLLTLQAEGPRPSSGYTNPRIIECALWDTCDSGGESVDSFDYEAGDVELLIALLRDAVTSTAAPGAVKPEPVPLFGQPEALLHFLEQAGDGRISGTFDEWPQFRLACRWAAEQIKASPSTPPEVVAPTPMPVSRYTFNHQGIVPLRDGEWVAYGDYEALESLYLQHTTPSPQREPPK